MKTFTRISILVLVMLVSSAVVFAQNNAAKTTISDVELKMMQDNPQKTANTGSAPADFLATPITSFPYFQDFESGWPAEMDDLSGTGSDAFIDNQYGINGQSLMLEGNTSTGWGSTPYSYSAAFDPSKASHFATAHMTVVPDPGAMGNLKMVFQFGQGYSFNSNYSWFRVLVDGAAAFNTGGAYYWQPWQHVLPSSYYEMEFDLSGYQGLSQFDIDLQASVKYYVDYYYEGDWSAIDDLKIWYELPPGDLEGYVMNGAGLSISGATVGMEGWGITTTDPTGYYFMSQAFGGNQTVWGWKAGYNQANVPVWIEPLSLSYQDIVLTAPTMIIAPTFHEYTLNPEEYFTTQTGITNSGDGPLMWYAEVVYPTTDFVVTDVQPRTSFPNPHSEYSPNVITVQVVNPPQRALWDVQLNFNTADNSGEAGVETDGNFIWTSMWNGSGFQQYNMDGTHVGAFSCGGASNLRDLAYDGMYMYGAPATTSVSQMDFNTQTVVGTINAATATRAIAYNDDNMTFYSNNWDTPITEWDMSGAMVSSFNVGSFGSLYGMAYDNWTDGGPYLWAFSQAGSGAVMAQYDIATGSEIFSLDVIPLVGGTQIAGGAFTTGSIVPGFISLGGILQNELVFALELAEGSTGGVGSWLTLDWYEGTNPGFGFIENVPTNFDASGTSPGEVYTADIVFTSSPDVGTSTIPCTMIIAGDPLTPPENLVVTLIDDVNGVVQLDWDWFGDAFQFFVIKRDGAPIGTSTTTSYIDNLPAGGYGTYCYTVQAYYDEGYTAPAGPECIEWPFAEIFVDPDFHEAWVWSDHTHLWTTTISNLGIGTLQYTFPNYVTDAFICEHSVEMFDSFGDGWNGNALDVFVDGVLVLDNITLSSGAGPGYEYFDCAHGAEITTVYDGSGGWNYEPEYNIIDGFGNIIGSDGFGNVTPSGIGPGQCYGACPVPSYIVDVTPATGLVPEGGSVEVGILWDATGFDPGDYPEDLLLESNDPLTPEYYIGNLMHVYDPGFFYGMVSDCESGAGVAGVTVTAIDHIGFNSWQTVTDNNGEYMLYVDPLSYNGTMVDVLFDKLGYESVIVADTFATEAGVMIDVTMCEAPYAVPWVLATVNYPDEDYCDVEWSLPEGPYELIYDDASAEDLFAWATPYNENAVKFTPAGYPATVIGGRVYVGDGLWPAGNWLTSEFAMLVYDDDGANGMPGTVVDSVPVIVTNYGWVEFTFTAPATFDDGEFYLSMMQLTYSPDCAPIGIDMEAPTAYRSYSRMMGTEWSTSIYQDFMLRAYVDGPQTDMITDAGAMVYPPKVPQTAKLDEVYSTMNNSPFVTVPGTEKAGQIANIEGYDNATDGVSYYTVARMSDFDPLLGPQTGTMTVLDNVTGVTYQDNAFQALPMGWYAYAVQTVYTSGLSSAWVFSNIVGRDMDAALTFEVTLCDGNTPEDVEITLQGEEYPFETFFGVTDATGIYTFEQVWKGDYTITVFKIGYETYTFTATITGDETFEVILSEKKYPPRNLWVDPLTSYAYWEPPLVMAIDEDFEGMFPPEGWQSTTNSCGWFQTADGSSGAWTVPTWTSLYACANDDDCGSDADGSVDYLITPPLDLREVDTYHLMFDSYYDAAFGQLATVEYSYDGGANWNVLYALTPMGGAWDYVDVDLAPICGMSSAQPVWIAFHADDGGAWASGWAVDNALIANGETDPDGYHVYLDGAFVAETDTTFYQYQDLVYGVTYTASVAAVYSCGLSDEIYYTFTSGWLYPPRNLDGYSQDDANLLWWEPPLAPETSYELLSVVPRTEFPNPHSEYSPMVHTVNVIGTSNRDQWDVQANFVCGDASGEAGVETDGNKIYTTKWNAGGGTFFEYELDGTFNGPLTVSGGAMDVRDLAYNDDDGLFYGSNAGTTVWGINFGTLTVDNTISAPTACRAIAYDSEEGGFWGNNWDTDLTLFDFSGAVLNSIPVGAFGSLYGLAYDNWTEDGPYLWAFSQAGAGAEFVQYDIATGSEIFNINTLPLVGGTQIAGGAFTHCSLYADNIVSLGGILQNELVFALELTGCTSGPPGPGNLVVPENLIGYKLYRDMNNIAYIPYDGEDTTYYWDFDLLPLCYIYEVSAIYDLTPYGFPGDTGESALEGPKEICTEYGWPLPFVENWETGSFDPNLWTSGENWVVNGQIGNPEPCTEFKWDPILTNYKSSLTSYAIDGKYHPNSQDPYIDGRIWFDFDVQLDNVNATGDEMLVVEIWENGDWYHVITFDNADGSFEWMNNHIEISNHAFGEIFRIRFTADGVESSDILSWFIDNINIYRACDPATELTAEGINPFEIDLNWTPPASGGGTGGGEWIFWDDGTHNGGIGLTGGGVFSVASHWDPDMIAQYDGQYITKIRFIPYANVVSTSFTLKVWSGADASNLLYEEPITIGAVSEWNEFTLGTPVMIDASQELWFGYTCDSPDGENPAGYDFGPAVAGYGDMITLDGVVWDPISTFGAQFDINWNLQAWVGDMTDGESVPLTYMDDNTVYSTPTATPTAVQAPTRITYDEHAVRALTGYNIYWNNDGAGYVYADFTTDTFYAHIVDPEFAVGSLQCYYVEAVYEDCVAPSNEACWIVTGIEDPELADAISVYPNPARDILNITSSSDITHVTVMNYVGQVVYNQKVVEDNDLQLNVAGYETGVYMVKVETTVGIVVKKVTIAH